MSRQALKKMITKFEKNWVIVCDVRKETYFE